MFKNVIFCSVSILLFLLMGNCNSETSNIHIKYELGEPIDSFFLTTNSYEIPRFISYDHTSKRYLSASYNKSNYYFLHDSKGKEVRAVKVPEDGPLEVSEMIHEVFDSNYIYFIARSKILKYDVALDKIIKSRTLDESLMLFSGGTQNRTAVYKNLILHATFDEADLEFGIGSKDFVRMASVVKIYDKNTLGEIYEIVFPSEIIYHRGIFQPTLYEPQFALDRNSGSLFLLFPTDPNFYQFDLNELEYKAKIPIRSHSEFVLPQPLDFGESGRLKANFQKDNQDLASLRLPFFIDEQLWFMLRPETNIDKKKYIEYNSYNEAENTINYLQLFSSGRFPYIYGPHSENSVIVKPNYDLFTEDPPGYPIVISKLVKSL